MAINKTINRSSKSKAGMRNCIEYVLKEGKTNPELMYMTGPAPDVLDWNNVYNSFMEEKEICNKTGGRLYNHNIISFHKDEKITQKEALEFGKEFAEKWFPSYQTLIAVHTDKNHTHIHMVTNTVSYIDGKKLHNSRNDLQTMKDFTNQMCKDRELAIAEKGKHFNGEEIEQGELIAWSKDKYNLINDGSKKSYVADCAIAILEVLEDICESISDFINSMQDKGWSVHWSDKRKNITFENEKGEKVRDKNISKTFNMNIGKEELIHEFERQSKAREERTRVEEEANRRNAELEQYYTELEHHIEAEKVNRGTAGNDSGFEEKNKSASGREDFIPGERVIMGSEYRESSEEDLREFLDNLNTKERNSKEKRADREAEQRRLDLERQREADRREREAEENRKKNKRRMREEYLEL